MSTVQYITSTASTRRTQIAFRHFWSLYRFFREVWEKEMGDFLEDEFESVSHFGVPTKYMEELLDRCIEICDSHKKYKNDIKIAFKLLPEDNINDYCIDSDYDENYFQNVKRLRDFLKARNMSKGFIWERG